MSVFPVFLPERDKIVLLVGCTIKANNKDIFRGCLSKTGTKTTNIWSEINLRKQRPQDSHAGGFLCIFGTQASVAFTC